MLLLSLKNSRLSQHLHDALSSFLHLQLTTSNGICPRPCTPLFRSLRSFAKVRTDLPGSLSLELKLDLLHRERFSPSQVAILQDDPYFLATSFERVSSFIFFLRSKGIIGHQAGSLLAKTPRMLLYTVQGLEIKCKFFEDLGIGTRGLQKLLACAENQTVLGTAMKTLQKHVDFLHGIGLDREDIARMVVLLPRILLFNVERKMEATVALFERHGMSKESFRSLVRLHPQVFGVSGRAMETLEIILGVGLDLRQKSGARAIASWITYNPDVLLSKWDFLIRQGFSDAEVSDMVKKQPGILATSENSLRRKIDYVKNVLNRDIRELANFPVYLGLSLENRIVPRFTYLKELGEKGKCAKVFSLGYLLAPSDQNFERRHATGYVKWKARYDNKEAGNG